ncbi:serine/threonine-protein kinase [Aquabacterium sp. OR-4]|uniref:serine/threonine-protein kinase n=1 Tax=Aquabacterium sp. OR-4 TaxID=2978127 RepID=UPI0021B4BFF7|nr:serine/threonine-protein kinase [Aquabacterium sp. OR-4]MDT7837911.1 serine/threonine-protein kinase [Aquabacterium sp. OR-4]
MKLQAHEWTEVLRQLDAALELLPTERGQWLAALALHPPHLKDALRKLLQDRRAIETADFLNAGAERTPQQPGTTLGPWRLLRELGRGGMATVWLAQRCDGAHQRQVALKLPQHTPGSRLITERFLRERAILSMLQHANIAQVLDAGEDEGQPWLALEYIEGQPITHHATAQGLDVPARLRLFLPVLQAVQHAHGQLVIHRDLKPANVMVDAQGAVKLLDFGVAKLLAADVAPALSADSVLTQLGGRAMTPQYASPEQVAGRPLGVSSDVYSLGVLLYELLTGQLPYRLKRDSAAALEEAILNAEVQRPSLAVGTAARSRALRGDLDTIVMKALALQPAARYASAAALAEDIERHLGRLPVRARPATWHYRLGRSLRRHALGYGAGTAVAVALLTGATVALWQAQRATAQAQQSQAVQAFLAKVLSYNDPQQAQGQERSARQLLTLAAGQIDTEFGQQPAVAARLHQTVGIIYFEMGAFQPAVQHLDRALARPRPRDAEWVDAMFFKAQAQRDLRDFSAAQASFSAAMAAGNALGPTPHRWSGRILASQAWLASQTGQLDQALPLAEQALAQQRAYSGEHSVDFLSVAQNVAALQIARGQIDDAQALIRQIERQAPTLPAFPMTDLLVTRAQLASVRFVRGDYAQAEADYRAMLPLFDQHLGKAHDRSAIARSTFARALAELGRADEAVTVQQANIANVLPRAAAEPEAVNLVRLQLVRLLTLAGQPQQAEALARELLAQLEARYAEPTRYRENARAFLADAVLAQGRRDEGVRLLQASLDFAARMGQADNPVERANKQWQLALASRHQAHAVSLADQACQAMRAALGSTNPRLLKCLAVLRWVQALHAAPEARAEAMAAFATARDEAVATVPAGHALRADLQAAQREIAAATPGPPTRLLSLH